MKLEGILEKVQDVMEKRLLSLNELRNIPILTYKQSDFKSVIEASVKTGIGIAILLMPPITSDVIRHVFGPVFNTLSVEIQIIENTATNRSGKSLLGLVETIMRHLHMWTVNVCNENYKLELAPGTNCCRAFREDDVNNFVIRFVMPCHFQTT